MSVLGLTPRQHFLRSAEARQIHRTSSLSLVCTPLREERESTENQLAALIGFKIDNLRDKS